MSSNAKYSIGIKIYVSAQLINYYGEPKLSGGDHLRAIIWNNQLNVSAPGSVTDYKNGTYLLTFECLWSGIAYISVSLAYAREAITALYRLINEVRFHHLFIQIKMDTSSLFS